MTRVTPQTDVSVHMPTCQPFAGGTTSGAVGVQQVADRPVRCHDRRRSSRIGVNVHISLRNCADPDSRCRPGSDLARFRPHGMIPPRSHVVPGSTAFPRSTGDLSHDADRERPCHRRPRQALRAQHRRAPRPTSARRGDRHQVRRHLPLRHPPGTGEVGRGDLPDGPGPRDRRRRPRGRPRGHQVRRRRPGRRGLLRRLLPRVRELPTGREAAVPAAKAATYNGHQYDGEPPSAATAPSSWTRASCSASPKVSSSMSPLRCCAPASPSSPRSSTGARDPARRSPSSAWAASATWA